MANRTPFYRPCSVVRSGTPYPWPPEHAVLTDTVPNCTTLYRLTPTD